MPDATDSLADATPDGAFTAPDAFAAGAHAQSLLPLAVACALVLLTTAAVLRKLYFRAAPGSDADALFAPPTPGADAGPAAAEGPSMMISPSASLATAGLRCTLLDATRRTPAVPPAASRPAASRSA